MVNKGFIFCMLSLFLFYSCDVNNPGSAIQDNQFYIDGVISTEAWIKLKLDDNKFLEVYRDDSLVFSSSKTNIDTTLIDDGLYPGRSYKYQLASSLFNKSTISKELTVKTLDSTSRVFGWQLMEFGGDAGFCVISDIAMINKNNIWGVGEIYLTDSLGEPDPILYNAVHWDGKKWEVLRIPYMYMGVEFYSPIHAISAFSEDDIWFGIGNVIHLKNGVYESFYFAENVFAERINAMWGSSSENLYIAGMNGQIAHFNGQNWEKIESGTTSDIWDIWGIFNPFSSRIEVYAVAAKIINNPESKLIKIVDRNVEDIREFPEKKLLSSVWSVDGKNVYLGEENRIRVVGNSKLPFPYGEKTGGLGIRGTGYNDIFVSGSFGFLAYYNGFTWKQITDEVFTPDMTIFSVVVKKDFIAITGFKGDKAFIITTGLQN